jgi:hypothetical protein
MNIRFISSLTADDENRLAPALLAALASVLDRLPLAYTLRFETTTGRAFQHVHSPDHLSEENSLSPTESDRDAEDRW